MRDRRVLQVLGTDPDHQWPVLEALQGRAGGEVLVVEPQTRVAERRDEPAVLAHELSLHEIHRGRADEAADENVERTVVELLGRRHLLQLALAHDRDAIAHRHRLDLVVRDVDRRHADVALELRDLGAHLDPQLRVEVGQRLVHQERGGLADDRASHRHPLALPTGERTRLAVEERLEVEDPRRIFHALVDLRLLLLPETQAEGDVVVDGQVRVERVALEHHRDVPVARRDLVHDPVADPDLAFGDLLEARHHPERGRLSAAGRADENHELAVLCIQREVGDGPRPIREDLRYI